MADQQVAATVEQIDRKEIRGARHTGAAVAGHGSSSLSVVLAGGPYRWISKALSTLRHHTRPHRRRIDVAGGRVENGGAFSMRFFQATSLRHPNRPQRRRIDVAEGRVENGEAFSTRHFQATSLVATSL